MHIHLLGFKIDAPGARDGDGVRGGWSDLLWFWTTTAFTYTCWD
jgi:hypothetical protein